MSQIVKNHVEEFLVEIWRQAFMAAISGCDGGRPNDVVDYAEMVANEALKRYKAKIKVSA